MASIFTGKSPVHLYQHQLIVYTILSRSGDASFLREKGYSQEVSTFWPHTSMKVILNFIADLKKKNMDINVGSQIGKKLPDRVIWFWMKVRWVYSESKERDVRSRSRTIIVEAQWKRYSRTRLKYICLVCSSQAYVNRNFIYSNI